MRKKNYKCVAYISHKKSWIERKTKNNNNNDTNRKKNERESDFNFAEP